MRLTLEGQMNFMNIQIESLVRQNHELRKINKLVSWAEIAKGFVELKSECGRLGYGVECGIRSLFVQFYYDLSDREMENRFMKSWPGNADIAPPRCLGLRKFPQPCAN